MFSELIIWHPVIEGWNLVASSITLEIPVHCYLPYWKQVFLPFYVSLYSSIFFLLFLGDHGWQNIFWEPLCIFLLRQKSLLWPAKTTSSQSPSDKIPACDKIPPGENPSLLKKIHSKTIFLGMTDCYSSINAFIILSLPKINYSRQVFSKLQYFITFHYILLNFVLSSW